MILVSACLLGINCKYDGNNNSNENVEKYLQGKQFIVVCPEQLGGLSTPRIPSEIIEDGEMKKVKVMSKEGQDVTHFFVKGAKEALKIAKIYNCKEAILKEGSPSCGSKNIYDGSFSGIKVNGMGITSRVLKERGIRILSEKDLEI
ncbi:MAG: DUF523 domain-containing protein [Paraclostridium sp.]